MHRKRKRSVEPDAKEAPAWQTADISEVSLNLPEKGQREAGINILAMGIGAFSNCLCCLLAGQVSVGVDYLITGSLEESGPCLHQKTIHAGLWYQDVHKYPR